MKKLQIIILSVWALQEEGVDQADFLNVIMFDPDVEDE